MAPAGSRISIERDLFPRLVDDGLFGYEASGYWMDIGTPQRYLQATWDILEGAVRTEVGDRVAAAHGVLCPDSHSRRSVHGPALLGAGCEIDATAVVTGRSVLGDGVRLGPNAYVDGSVLLDGASVGEHSRVIRSVVGPGAAISDHCRLEQATMVGAGVRLGARNVLTAGVRIFPDVELPDGAITF